MTKKLSDLKRKNGLYEYTLSTLDQDGFWTSVSHIPYRVKSVPEAVNHCICIYNDFTRSFPNRIKSVRARFRNQSRTIDIVISE